MLTFMVTIAPGEILLTDIEAIDPQRARKLGVDLLEGLPDDPLSETYRVRLFPEVVTQEVAQDLERLLNLYEGLLSANGQLFDKYAQWLIPGREGAYLPWHVDTPGDVRFMTNLGERPTHVDVATEWDPELYDPGFTDGLQPISFRQLILEPGQTYVSNALATNINVLPPHKTPIEPSRVVLRTSIYALYGWREDAKDAGGITVQLG